jgi:hypothetical protein
MKRHTYHITLTLEGPILTKSSSPSDFGVDAAFARIAIGPAQGKCCIPATHIKGKLRESLAMSGLDSGKVEALFGKASPDESLYDSHPGNLRFSAFIAQDTGSPALHTRIKVDDASGSVERGALLVEEMPFGFGQQAIFTGRISSLNDCPDLENILHRAFGFLTHIGSNRSIGYGKFLSVTIEKISTQQPSLSIPDGDILLPLTISPEGFLCITKHKIGGNLMESDDVIPGNMLAGAIMATAKHLGHDATLKSCFNDITFRHAIPCHPSAERPQAMPLSLVQHEKKFYDCVSSTAITAHNEEAPAFATDWKTTALAEERYPRVRPFRELIVRTAIDSEKGTADRGEGEREGKLFAWEVIHPFDGENKPIVWKSLLRIPASITPEQRHALADTLTHLSYLSKSKVDANVTLGKAIAPPTVKCTQGETLSICLQSPALLADPWRQEKQSGGISAEDMHALYAKIFEKILPSLKLVRFYTQQHMAGGAFLWHHFQNKRQDYYPWILTTPGSVFTFTVEDETSAQAALTAALISGLPLPPHHKDDTWQTNPYIPANGFGEIRIHQPLFPAYPPHV